MYWINLRISYVGPVVELSASEATVDEGEVFMVCVNVTNATPPLQQNVSLQLIITTGEEAVQ